MVKRIDTGTSWKSSTSEVLAKLVKNATLPTLSRLAQLERSVAPASERDGMPPGETGFFPTLHGASSIMFGDMLEFFAELVARHGGGAQMLPVRFRFVNKPSVLLTHPRHIDRVFRDGEHFSQSSDPQILARFRRLLGFNLVSAEQEDWSRTRPRTSALLNGPALAEYGQVMREVMEEDMLPILFRAADAGQPIDIFETMLAFSSKVVFRSFMRLPGSEVPNEVHATLSRLFDHVRRHVVLPSLPLWVPTPGNRVFERDRDVIRDFVRPYIRAQAGLDTMLGSIVRAHTIRRPPTEYGPRLVAHIESLTAERSASDRDSLLRETHALLSERAQATVHSLGESLTRLARQWTSEAGDRIALPKRVLQAQFEAILCEGGNVDSELVLEEIVSNLIGGSETTILLMTWGLFYLSRAPAAQERLHVEASMDREHTIPLIQPANLRKQQRYLFNVIRETLRLAPPAASFVRYVISTVDLDEFTLPKGTLVWGSQYSSHRNPHVWNDPEQFVPERFEAPVTPGAFFPFVLGPRQCVGMNYAYVEAAIALATIAKFFSFECITEQVGYDLGLTYRPDRPVELLLRRR